MKKVIVFLAEGYEEVEALTPIDYLRRAGFNVLILGVTGKAVKSARNISIEADEVLTEDWADTFIKECSVPNTDIAGVVIPGGLKGSKNIAGSVLCEKIVRQVLVSGGFAGAICAAPALVLGSWGLLKGKKFTCYPGMENEVKEGDRTLFSVDRVVRDGQFITSRGAGCAEEFSFEIIRYMGGEDMAQHIREQVVARSNNS